MLEVFAFVLVAFAVVFIGGALLVGALMAIGFVLYIVGLPIVYLVTRGTK